MATRRDDEGRPDPDALLERVRAEEREATRAKLRMFFGASPGVGKTYTMLENARRLVADGVDVVVGVVETHGREETAALLEGLERIPPKRIPYRGRTLLELDLDAALARRPAVLLLDELAHTNAPGSRHAKRWQDALELLEAGIEVHTTLNVQHVESLNDVVAQITHVRVRETVPDAIVERADDIELVDVPPEVVLERLREGKVYVAEQADRAAGGFFKAGNLHALRELALRLTAEHVEADVQAWRRQQGIEATWPTRERIMVCVGPAPQSARLIRAARRTATALRAPWIAATVERPSARAISQDDRERLASHLRLAESLGAEVAVLSGEKPAARLLELAHEKNVTRILVGKPTHARWRDLVYGSLLDDLIRGSGDIDVNVIVGEGPDVPSPGGRDVEPRPPDLWRFAWGIAPVLLAAGLSRLVLDHVGPADIAMMFVAAIATSSTYAGRGPSVVASVVAVLIFDFFFVPPYLSFVVSDLRFTITFVVMLLVGILISSLTDRIRRQSHTAREREKRTAALYALSRALAGARDREALAAAAAAQIVGVFESPSAVLLPDEDAESGLSCPASGGLHLTEADVTVARWSFEHRRPAGRGLDTLPGARILAIPLVAADRAIGVLAVAPVPEARFVDPSQRHLLETFVAQITLALERASLAEEAQQAELRAKTEELRSSLLSSVSHDLRTPIATVLGAATTLLDSGDTLPRPQRDELLETVRDEAARLARLVSNLLDMMRVESGSLDVKKEWVPVEELVGTVMSRIESRLEGRAVELAIPRDLVTEVDPVLMEQVLWNLLENALKHTAEGTPITVAAREEDGTVLLEVADRGSGIAAEVAPRVFEKFVRGGANRGGVGLGLAICRGIVEAHGGTVEYRDRRGGGASFRVRLPRATKLPEPTHEEPTP